MTRQEYYSDPVGIFDDLDETLGIKRFFSKGEALGKWIPDDQKIFLKLMVEDPDFLFLVHDRVDQNWFDEPELKDILRTIRDFYNSGTPITYHILEDALKSHYDLSIEYQEVSWLIIKEVLDDMRELPADNWKCIFIKKIEEQCITRNIPSDWS